VSRRDPSENVEEMLAPQKMLSELREDNSLLTGYLRETHEICAKYNDVATTSLDDDANGDRGGDEP
jgi:DNA-binding ferritin-like protein